MKLQSIWKVDASAARRPSLSQDLELDVAVIGGGITGVTTAHRVCRSGSKVALFEARRIGEGTTGYSTGNLYTTVDQHFEGLLKRYDRGLLTRVAEVRGQAVDDIAALVAEHAIACDFVRVPLWLVAEDEQSLPHIDREVEAAHAANVVARRMEPNEIPLPFATHAAAHFAQQAQIQPLQYVRGLAEALPPACQVYEHTPIVDVNEVDGHTTLTTAAGHKVRARHVIMATHTPKGNSFAHTVLGPYREYAIAVKLRSDEGLPPPGIFWVMSDEHHHSMRRVTTDDGQAYLIVLGTPHKVGQEKDTEQAIADVVAFTRARFDVAEVSYAWGAQAYRPADGLPYIGPRSSGSNVYLATGYAADGLVWGTAAARILDDLVHERDNPVAETFAYTRHTPIKSAMHFVKENVNVALQYLRDWPFKGDVPEVEVIAPDDGKIVEVAGHKLAVYRTTEGKLQCVSAVCTHLGCIVRFNRAERSWDCPCHGSRFGVDGTVLEGPAFKALHRYVPERTEESK